MTVVKRVPTKQEENIFLFTRRGKGGSFVNVFSHMGYDTAESTNLIDGAIKCGDGGLMWINFSLATEGAVLGYDGYLRVQDIWSHAAHADIGSGMAVISRAISSPFIEFKIHRTLSKRLHNIPRGALDCLRNRRDSELIGLYMYTISGINLLRHFLPRAIRGTIGCEWHLQLLNT